MHENEGFQVRLHELENLLEIADRKADVLTGLLMEANAEYESALARVTISERNFHAIFETAPEPIYLIDANTNKIVDCNECMLDWLGYSREEILSKIADSILDPKSIAGESAISYTGSTAVSEWDFRKKDGTHAVAEVAGTPIEYNGLQCFAVLARDVTERKRAGEALRKANEDLEIKVLERTAELQATNEQLQLELAERKKAEEALQRSEHLYRSVIENIADVFYRTDAESRLVMASPSGARLFGYASVDEMYGLHLGSLWVNPVERDRLLEIVREQGNVMDFEGVLKKKDGSPFSASISAHFYRDEDGAVIGTEGIIRDISERRRIEDQLRQSQKMEAMGTLAGGLAHEINNLLQVVLGHADMLLWRGGTDEVCSKSLEAIRKASRNGSHLVNRVLTFSRKAEPKMRPLNLSNEVRRLEEMLRRTIPRMISVEMFLADDLSVIGADPSQIEQVVLNLAINARDAMPEGGRLIFETKNVTLREAYCRTHPEVKPGKYVRLAVSDTGQGMESSVSDHIFEPFFTTKQPGQGSGLGLSIVFGVVASHGGHITCYSEPGVGTTFKIFFPVLTDSLQSDMATTLEMPMGGTETILLVDDDDDVRVIGAEMLEMAGYTVHTSANGREALEVYRKKGESISLVVLDLIMPEMSGRHCLEQLLKLNPNAKVLVASGYAADGPAKEARESGAKGFVSKPFDIKEILLAIRRCLDNF